ncbi:hypothetical protein [Staphylococcus delphini]|uniref:hypothetical protein n=1 Tax=Staphylococcus delphini TaxID=53344 RepID=UPI001F4D51D7|nr:hypothetical protein [Staphylococcus delphini]
MNRQSKRYFKWKSGFTILVLVAMAIFAISIFSSDPSTVAHTKTEDAKFADNKSETSKAATIQTTNQNENVDALTSHQTEPMKATAETTFKAAKPGTTDKIPVKLVKAVDGDTAGITILIFQPDSSLVSQRFNHHHLLHLYDIHSFFNMHFSCAMIFSLTLFKNTNSILHQYVAIYSTYRFNIERHAFTHYSCKTKRSTYCHPLQSLLSTFPVIAQFHH